MISDAESLVMDLLWQRHPQSAEELVAALGPQQGWQEPTIKTLLNRLLNKGAVQASKDGRRYLYSPQLAREDWQLQLSRSLLERCFGGRVAPLVAQFGARGQLSAQDLAELRELLDSLDAEDGNAR